jgi:hypothetical protein
MIVLAAVIKLCKPGQRSVQLPIDKFQIFTERLPMLSQSLPEHMQRALHCFDTIHTDWAECLFSYCLVHFFDRMRKAGKRHFEALPREPLTVGAFRLTNLFECALQDGLQFLHLNVDKMRNIDVGVIPISRSILCGELKAARAERHLDYEVRAAL